MDDVFHRNSAKRVAEYFVVVGLNFQGLLELLEVNNTSSDSRSQSGSPHSTPSKLHEFDFHGGYIDILSTSFEASVLHRYPDVTDHDHESHEDGVKFPEGLEFFCFPTGLTISSSIQRKDDTSMKRNHFKGLSLHELSTSSPIDPFPRSHSFIHTSESGGRMVGTCLTFFEELTESEYEVINTVYQHMQSLRPSTIEHDDLHSISSSTLSTNSEMIVFGPNHQRLYVEKALCILSYWPFVEEFKTFLNYLYQMVGTNRVNNVCMERYICNFIDDVPAPPAGKIDVIYYLNEHHFISFKCPPLNVPSTYIKGFPLQPLFECMHLHNILTLFACVLTERQILLISSQYSLLTNCAEALVSLLYPLTWSHAYIPILPSRLLGK